MHCRSFHLLGGIPLHTERIDAQDEVVADGAWDVGRGSASGHVDGDDVGWEEPVGCSIHGEGLVVEPLTGHGESFTWGSRCFVELNVAVFARFNLEDKGVDFVAEFGGESGFEERTVVLSVEWFRWVTHGCLRRAWSGSCLILDDRKRELHHC